MTISAISGQTRTALQDLGIFPQDPPPADPNALPDAPAFATDFGNIGQALLNIPFPEMITKLGRSVADAQFDMDLLGARMAQVMAGQPINDEGQAVTIDFAGEQGLTLFEIGFTPSFYHFSETVIDVKFTLNFATETTTRTFNLNVDLEAGYANPAAWKRQLLGADTHKVRLNTSIHNSETSSKYNVSGEGTSAMKTTLVPIPPPAVLEERIRLSVEKRNVLKNLVREMDDDPTQWEDNFTTLIKELQTIQAQQAAQQ